MGIPYSRLVDALKEMQARLHGGLQGFHQMTEEEVAADCGLSLEQARRAKLREYDEPFILQDQQMTVMERVCEQAAQLGLSVTQGGRYFHLLGGNDKGRAVHLLSRLFMKADAAVVTMALGDSPNDLPMLQAVDLPFLVRKSDGHHDDTVLRIFPAVRLADGIAGWNAAVTEILTNDL